MPHNFGHVIWQAFYWPGGALLGNLLAQIIWSSIFDWHHHKKTRRVIREVKAKEPS